jgi:WD40 repeat protein/tetratricopeptide (TPR) repeat protein
VATTADDPFTSLSVLQERYYQLLELYEDDHLDEEVVGAIEAFIASARQTGVFLKTRKERLAAQRSIDFCAAVLFKHTSRPRETALAAWDKNRVPALGEDKYPYGTDKAFEPSASNEPIGWTLLLERCLNKLRLGKRLLAIIGPQRSGRSHVLQAGLLPALKQGGLPRLAGTERWHYLQPLIPSEHVGQRLAKQISQVPEGSTAVVSIDGLELLFTTLPRPQVEQFLEQLLALLPQHHVVLLTIRSDNLSFLDGAAPGSTRERFKELVKQGEVSTQFDTRELRRIIEIPADNVGLKFEDDRLVDHILSDVQGDPAALSLLQFSLRRLWDKKEQNVITWHSYTEAGAGRIALSRAADAVYAALTPDDQQIARAIFLQLVHLRSREVRPAPVSMAALVRTCGPRERVEAIVRRYVDAGLLEIEAERDSAQITVAVDRASASGWTAYVILRLLERLGLWELAPCDTGTSINVLLGPGPAALPGHGEPHPRRAFADRILHGLGELRLLHLTEPQPAARTPSVNLAQESLVGYWPTLEAWIQQERYDRQQAESRRRLYWVLAACLVILVASSAYITALWRALDAEHEARKITEGALDTQKKATAAQEKQAKSFGLAWTSLAFDKPALQQLRAGDSAAAIPLFLAGNQVRSSNKWEPTDWNAAYGMVLDQLPRPAHWQHLAFNVEYYAISPRGDTLVAGGDGMDLLVFDLGMGGEPQSVTVDGPVNTVAFSPDGDYLAVGYTKDRTSYIQVYRARDWNTLGSRLEAGTGAMGFLAVSAYADFVAAAPQDPGWPAQIWQKQRAQVSYRRLEDDRIQHNGKITAIALAATADGVYRFYTAGEDGNVKIWSLPRQGDERITPLNPLPHPDKIGALQLTSDGTRLVCRYGDAQVKVWSLPDPAAKEYKGAAYEHKQVSLVGFDREAAHIISAGTDGSVQVRDVPRKEQPEQTPLTLWRGQPQHKLEVTDFAASPDDRFLATASRDQTVLLWNLTTGIAQLVPLPHRGQVERVWFSANGRYLFTLNGIPPTSSRPDCNAASVPNERELRKWDLASLGRPRHVTMHAGLVTDVAVSPDGRTVASASDEPAVRVWGAGERTLDLPLEPNESGVSRICFSSAGTRLAALVGSPAHHVVLWRTSGEPLAALAAQRACRLDTSKRRPLCLAVAEAGQVAVGCEDGTVLLWQGDDSPAQEFRDEVTRKGERPSGADAVKVVRLSDDGRWLAAGYAIKPDPDVPELPAAVVVWDLKTKLARAPSTILHRDDVLCLAFHPREGLVVSGSADDQVAMFDYASGTGTVMAPGQGHRSDVVSVAFDRAGKRIVSAGLDFKALVWDLESKRPILQLLGHESRLTSAAFDATDRWIATTTLYGRARLWSATTGDLFGIWDHRAPLNHAAFTLDGERLLLAGFTALGRGDLSRGTGSICTIADLPLRGPPWAGDAAAALTAINPNQLPLAATEEDLAKLEPERLQEQLAKQAGGVLPLTNKQMKKTWEDFQKYKNQKPVTDEDWYRRAARESEVTGSWTAALWYLDATRTEHDWDWHARRLRAIVNSDTAAPAADAVAVAGTIGLLGTTWAPGRSIADLTHAASALIDAPLAPHLAAQSADGPRYAKRLQRECEFAFRKMAAVRNDANLRIAQRLNNYLLQMDPHDWEAHARRGVLLYRGWQAQHRSTFLVGFDLPQELAHEVPAAFCSASCIDRAGFAGWIRQHAAEWESDPPLVKSIVTAYQPNPEQPADAPIILLSAMVHSRFNQRDKALKQYDQVFANPPAVLDRIAAELSDADLTYLIGYLDSQERRKESVVLYRQASKRVSLSEAVRYDYALKLLRADLALDNPMDALGDMKAVQSAMPLRLKRDATFLRLKARIAAAAGSWSLAAPACETLVQLAPGQQAFEYQLALCRLNDPQGGGRYRTDCTAWRKQLAADKIAEVLTARLWLLLLGSEGPEDAQGLVELIERRLGGLRLADGEYTCTLGAALLRAGRLAEAIASLDQARTHTSLTARPEFLFAQACAAAGRHDQAQQALKRGDAAMGQLDAPPMGAGDEAAFWTRIELKLLRRQAETAIKRNRAPLPGGQVQ